MNVPGGVRERRMSQIAILRTRRCVWGLCHPIWKIWYSLNDNIWEILMNSIYWFKTFIYLFIFNFYFYFILLYNSVLVLPYIDMNPPRVYMRSQTWTPLPPPSPWHLSGSLPCTSPKHAVSCFGHRLAIRFLHDSIHVRMPFSQVIPPLTDLLNEVPWDPEVTTFSLIWIGKTSLQGDK